MLKNYARVLVLFVLFSPGAVFAQDYITAIQEHLTTNRSTIGVETEDIQDFRISNEVFTRHNDVTHVYAVQLVNGIPIRNAMVNAAFKNGSIVFLSETLENDVVARATATSPSLNPLQAAVSAASALGLGGANFEVQTAVSSQEFILNTGNVSLENVPVKLVYVAQDNDSLKLAWDLSIHTLNGEHWWSVRIDALTGELINKNDWIVSCTFESHNHKNTSTASAASFSMNKAETSTVAFAGEQYNVFPMPIESPNHGDASLVVDPQDLTASPFGWHDTDGAAGAEFTITRGNNVWAQEDINGNNGVGEAPDGGEDLNFNFPFDFDTAPANMVEAATTNLFYWNNVIHDVFYYYGFDEASGNFQETNYTGVSGGSDSVNADAQDGSSLNNATFATPPDGGNPRMQMFLWSAQGPPGNSVTVNGGPLAGEYAGVPATFGAPLPEDTPITSDLVLLNDDNTGNSTDEIDGCDPITNGGDMTDSIVVIRRGACEFGVKILAAENEGAIAVIMVNNVPTAPIGMAGGAVGDQVTIPSVMVSQEDGEALIAALQNGDTVNVSLLNGGPFQIDGDVDNGIILHEYGHGISNRLTGGAANSGCLSNDEQMGEGWSDYFGMMLTMREGDTAEQGRGVGTYAIGQPITGQGIRPAAYSTDFAVNDLTYLDTNNTAAISQPHGIGTVWATMLWDMTWAFIDQYGFDADMYNGTGGNNIAMQLVVDGLKLQSCSPGFVDGRDAILAAVDVNDAFTTDQERRDAKCTVYTAFANRGVGFSASQGSRFSRVDQVEAFDFPEGNDNFCNPLSIEDRAGVNFRVFPNPSNGEININVGNNIGEGTVSIMDINGRVVFSARKALEGTVSVQATGLATGIYLLQVQNETISQTTKIVIE